MPVNIKHLQSYKSLVKKPIVYPFLPLDYPTTEKKKPCQELATIGGASHSLLGFLFAVSSCKRKRLLVLIIKMVIP